MSVSWPAVGAADLFDLEFSEDPTFARSWSQTTPSASIPLADLRPSTAYALRVRAHAAGVGSLAIGWGNFSRVWRCSTAATRPGAPGVPARDGPLATDSVGLRWAAASGAPSGYRVEGRAGGSGSWRTLNTTSGGVTSCTLTGLLPATAYQLRVITSSGSSVPGESTVLRTADAALRQLEVWRVTDFLANEKTVDFLGDHDGGSALGVSLFMAGSKCGRSLCVLFRSLKDGSTHAAQTKTTLGGNRSTSARRRWRCTASPPTPPPPSPLVSSAALCATTTLSSVNLKENAAAKQTPAATRAPPACHQSARARTTPIAKSGTVTMPLSPANARAQAPTGWRQRRGQPTASASATARPLR